MPIDEKGNFYFNNKSFDTLPNIKGESLPEYQEYLGKAIDRPFDSQKWNDERAKAQNGWAKLGNSLGQGVGTFGTALASSVASLASGAVGLGAETADAFMDGDQYSGMDIMLNNPVMKGISDFDKYIKEEIVPTYYTKEQQDKVFSAALGTDLLNGVGFMASAILPNAAITKLFGSMAKLAAASKLGKLEGTLAAALQTGELTSVEAGMISKTANFLNKSGPIIGATVGRIGESSMEAYQTYESMLANGASEEEAKQGRNNVFMGNMALAASDLAQYTRWFKGASLGDDLIKKGLSTTVKEKGKAELIGGFLKEASQEAGEEGFQFLLSKGAEKATKGKSFIDGISEASGDLFTTTEGLKSMLLGAVLGGGMGAISEARNSKKHKEDLANMANELTQTGDTTQRYVETPDGKRVINPELTKIATQFIKLEELKDQASAAGDTHTYNILEKIQFANLVEAKNRAGQFDEFVDQLESMGRSTSEEVKSMFGNLPMKNGREMSPMEVMTEKIAQAKKIKQTSEGLDLLPQLTKKDEKGKEYFDSATKRFIRNELFTQEALREEILNLNGKIAEVNSRAKINPIVENGELFEPELEQWDQLELNDLVETKKTLEEQFLETSKMFKEFVAKPETARQKVDDIQNNNVREAITKEEEVISKDRKTTEEAENKLNKLKLDAENPITVDTENGQIGAILNEDGILVNAETGEPIEGELLEQFKKQIADNELIETEEAPEEYNPELEDGKFLKGPKKPDTYSTSTRGHEIDYVENSQGKVPRDIEGLYQYVLYQAHEIITKWFANPKNSPSTTKKFTAKLTEVPITQELLDDINKVRLSRNNNPETLGKYPQLTLEDLQLPQYKPLRMWLYENGKLVKASEENEIHFHEVDYFYQTQLYTKIIEDDKLSKEAKEDAINKEIDRLTKERTKLVENLDTAELKVEAKSNGVLNFLPNKKEGSVSKRRVMPISSIANQKGNYGIGYVESVDSEGNAVIKYQKAEVKTTIEQKGKFKAGDLVFDVISANGQHLPCNNITKNQYSQEQIESLADLIMFKVTSGIEDIKVGKESFNIKSLLRNFIFVGANENQPENTIGFSKEGDVLILGRDKRVNGVYDNSSKWTKERAVNDPVELRNALINMLSLNYHSYPNPSITELNNNAKVVLPTKIDEDGEATGKVITMKEMFLDETNPLIGTNLNPNMPFINSYFSFEIDGGGLVFPVKEEQTEEYASNLESKEQKMNVPLSKLGNLNVQNNVSNQPSQVKPDENDIEAKKADIERRRQEANNKNEKFWEQFTAINAEEVLDRDSLLNKLIKDIPLPANTRINNWVLEELNGKLWEAKNVRGKEEEIFGKENWNKIKEAKKQFDIEFKKIEDSNLAKIKLIDQKQSDFLSTIEGLELRKAWSLGLIEEPNIIGLDETNFISKDETDDYEGYYYLSKPDKDGDWYETIIGKTEQEVKDEINAKYDAELAALKGKPDEVVKDKTPDQVMEKLEETDPCLSTKVNPETNTKLESNGEAKITKTDLDDYVME